MTRSEERMHVGTTTEQTGRVRLRKYVVTENVQQTVPVSHEEVRVEREPVTDANRAQAMSGPELSGAEHEVTLHEERVAVTKETVPVERVRLAKERVTGEETVSGEIRKERVEIEGEPESGTTRRSAPSGETHGHGRYRRHFHTGTASPQGIPGLIGSLHQRGLPWGQAPAIKHPAPLLASPGGSPWRA